MPTVPVRIRTAAVAHPEGRLTQDEACRQIGAYAGDVRRVAALARGTHIAQRAIALSAEELTRLGGSGARNDVYRRVVPALAFEAARGALCGAATADISCLVTSSCTGYTVPSWGVGLARRCGLPLDATRLPITEAGCAGGAVALTRAVEHLQARGGKAALVVAAELCSLAFHPGGDDGNITSTLIFGDGAGAALLETGEGPGLTVVDAMSVLVPDSEYALGFDLTDLGFYPVLSRELVALLPAPTADAVATLLARNAVRSEDVGAWLFHPGGARILSELERALALERAQTRWSWASMEEFGNTSSAAIFDVLRRYFDDARPGEYAVVAAFGPGVSIELLLLRAAC